MAIWYPSVNYTAEQSELADGFFFKKQEANNSMRELKKVYNSLKSKVNKYERKIVFIDEEKEKMLILLMSRNIQLALNKYMQIDKFTKQCKDILSLADKEYKKLPLYAAVTRTRQLG